MSEVADAASGVAGAEGVGEKSNTSHRDYINSKIEEIWRCEVPVHYICVVGPNGDHHELGIQELELWGGAIIHSNGEKQRGEATVRNPPGNILPRANAGSSASVSAHTFTRSLPYTPSISTTASRFGDASGLLPLRPRLENRASKGISRLGNGLERMFNGIMSHEAIYSVLRKWENELRAWNVLWHSSPDLQRRNRLSIPSSRQGPSEFQRKAWEFATRANIELIARVRGSQDSLNSESMSTEELQSLACMIDIMVGAVGELSEVKTHLHPGQGVLIDIVNEIPLSNYEAAAHFIIAAYAFKLIASFDSRARLLQLETTDIKLFRIVLHVMTNPQIRVSTKIYDILMNLIAVRRQTMTEIDLLRRPYEVAAFALCMSADIRFFEVQDGLYGIPGLLGALENAQELIANGDDVHNMLWLRMYKTLHAINDMFLQVPGLMVDLDAVIKLMKLVLVKPPKYLRRQFRHVLLDSIGAVLCGSPGIFRQIFPYQRRSIQLCLDILRAWTDTEEDAVRKREMLLLCSLLAHTCFSGIDN